MLDISTREDLDKDYSEICAKRGIPNIEECPICSTAIAPSFLCIIEGEEIDYIISQCPKCNDIFVQRYNYVGAEEEIFPRNAAPKKYDKLIENISKNFVKTYNQSMIAEANNLNEIAGMGYRKALEYLIKDYLISILPDKEKEIKKAQLGQCVNQYVENEKIKKTAKRATWLGNDETHYERRWVDKDINDLKNLIELTVYWISYELMTEEYNRLMQDN
jgi:hypothetical protein